MRLPAFLAASLLTLSAVYGGHAQAMTLETQGKLLFATGPVEDDLAKFEAAFAQAGIDTVVFVNSPGGDLWNGVRIGRLIADKGLNTVVAGSCASACSIMFIGGKERRFSDAFKPNQTYIGIHGAANKNTREVSSTVQASIYAFYKLHMGEKFNHSVMNQALNDMEDASALLKVFESARNLKVVPIHCRSNQTLRKDCTMLTGQDAASLGIITHTDLVKLSLPEKFKPVDTLLGQELPQPMSDIAAYFSDVASRQCRSDTCKVEVPKLAQRPEIRSVAVPREGKGLGWNWGTDSSSAAMLRAVFSCNHPKDQPARLCEPEMVSDVDVRPIYRAAQATHKTALAKLAVPADKFYASEEYGGGSIATLPHSQALIFGGHAVADAMQDAAFEKRFEGLLKLLAPEPKVPVVFYCFGRNSWLSVNAALRAKKLGYTQVIWYRGGVESWRAAALPTATSLIYAVAQ